MQSTRCALIKAHRVDCIVSKNAGGSAAYAKIEVAREQGLPVIMIDRPPMPPRHELARPEDVMAWLAHAGTDLGV